MKQVTWYKGIVLTQDQDAVKDYLLDFSQWLGLETIASVSFVTNGCACALLTQNTTAVKVRVSAVAVLGEVVVKIVTASGQRDDFTIKFKAISK